MKHFSCNSQYVIITHEIENFNANNDYLFFKDFHALFLFNELKDLMQIRMSNQAKVRKHVKSKL
jgi:hypothetical protein